MGNQGRDRSNLNDLCDLGQENDVQNVRAQHFNQKDIIQLEIKKKSIGYRNDLHKMNVHGTLRASKNPLHKSQWGNQG